MALAAKRPCAQFGCRELVPHGVKHCTKHSKDNSALNARRAYDRDRDSQDHRRIYGLAVWSKLRMMKLRQDPYCELADLCVKRTGRPAAASVVDHIKSVQERPDLSLDMDNLRSCCKPCHDKRTATEQGFAQTKTDPEPPQSTTD